jgi:hypothetical protein
VENRRRMLLDDLEGIRSYYPELSDVQKRACIDKFAAIMGPHRVLLGCACCGVIDYGREVQKVPVFGNLGILELNYAQTQDYLRDPKVFTVTMLLPMIS